MKPLCNKKVIIVMRHGERIDLVDRKKQRLKEYDPELTALGKKQAKEIGQRVLERCDKFDYVNVYSSPFTRTLMTGLAFIDNFNICDNKCIYISKDLSEFLSINGFKYDPLPTLLINNTNKFIRESFLNFDDINVKYFTNKDSKDMIKYPEVFEDAVKRYTSIGEEIFERIKNDNKKGNSLNVIITHGYGVQIITDLLLSKCKSHKNIVIFPEYCSSYCFNNINDTLNYVDEIVPSF